MISTNSLTKEICSSKVLYIKLGRKGEWEHECIHEKQMLRIGFKKIAHELCLNKKWDEVLKECMLKREGRKKSANDDLREIRNFYESDKNVLWITFHGKNLWWCFSECKVTLESSGNKTRSVIGSWKNTDVKRNILHESQLSGKILKKQYYQRTICEIKGKELEYLINIINGKPPKHIREAQESFSEFTNRIEKIIQNLYWGDFEILIDLIFRQSGLKRVSCLGKTEKILDLDLISPITKNRYGVQIKSKADLKKFKEYQQKFEELQGYSKFYFIVHSPSIDLQNYEGDERVELILSHEIAQWVVEFGLIDWIFAKGT